MHSLRFTPLAGCSTVLASEVAEHLPKCALVDGRIKRSGKKEHLLSWPFLGQIPEVAWIGDRQTTDFMSHVQQVFVPPDEHISLSSPCGSENLLAVFQQFIRAGGTCIATCAEAREPHLPSRCGRIRDDEHCSKFRSSAALNGTSCAGEQMGGLVRSSRST